MAKKPDDKNILCIKCDSYVPKDLAFKFAKPMRGKKPWLTQIMYTGECHSCKKTSSYFRKIFKIRY